MPKFFVNPNNIDLENKTITIAGDNVNHINVLRYKKGDCIDLISDYIEYNCTIEEITKKEIMTSINSSCKITNELNYNINLYQGIAKGDKMDNIIQKATELGIHEIIPVNTKFTVVKFEDDKRLESKLSRWQKIAQEAAEQSERGYIPQIVSPLNFENALNKAKDEGFVLFCYGREDSYTIKQFLRENKINDNETISIFIGPEGGFSKEEIELLDKYNIKPTLLGDSILRTETASIVAISMIKYENM